MTARITVPFNRPLCLGREQEVVADALASGELSAGGVHDRFCEDWLLKKTGAAGAFLTTSCTQALELSAILVGILPGDEVIMPSWTFPSTANAFVLRGATPVFIDIHPDTCNMDASRIEAAITPKTRAIVPVHYAGVSCDMDVIMSIAEHYGLWVIEDAAQAVMSSYRSEALGSLGHLGTYSFHATKNYTSGGEGGALLVNSEELIEPARILRQMGTNRDAFMLGEVSRYEWIDVGTSGLLSELQSAALSVQLRAADEVNDRRLGIWARYYQELRSPCEIAGLRLPVIPEFARHNAHMFYLRASDRVAKDALLGKLHRDGVMAQTHYVPLHVSAAGKRFGRFSGIDRETLSAHETLIRLPMYYSLTESEQQYVIDKVKAAI